MLAVPAGHGVFYALVTLAVVTATELYRIRAHRELRDELHRELRDEVDRQLPRVVRERTTPTPPRTPTSVSPPRPLQPIVVRDAVDAPDTPPWGTPASAVTASLGFTTGRSPNELRETWGEPTGRAGLALGIGVDYYDDGMAGISLVARSLHPVSDVTSATLDIDGAGARTITAHIHTIGDWTPQTLVTRIIRLAPGDTLDVIARLGLTYNGRRPSHYRRIHGATR